MKKYLWSILIIIVISLSFIFSISCARQPDYRPTADWKTSTPEEQGMDSSMLLEALEKIEQLQYDVHSLLVIKNGYLVMEVYYYPYHKDIQHLICSSTKSFTSTLIGIAIDKGYIKDEKQKVLDFFQHMSFENMDEQKKDLTIQDLLTMRSGLDWPEWSYYFSNPKNPFYGLVCSNNWVKFILDKKITTKPATQFNYNSGNSHLLAAIIAQSTEQDVAQFAVNNLFNPLGINEFYWPDDPNGIKLGGWGLFLRPRDMAKLGYLFLRKGEWDGKQIVSSQWVKAASQKHVEWENRSYFDPKSFAYGYQWWIGKNGAYSAQGAGGQVILIVPEKDLIIVTTGNLNQGDLKQINDTFKNRIIGAIKSDGNTTPNKENYNALKKKIEQYAQIEKQEGFVPEQIKKYLNKTFLFKENYIGLTSLRFITVKKNEIEVALTYHDMIMNSDITNTYTIGLDNKYRATENGYNPFFNPSNRKETINILMKGKFNNDNSISVISHALGTPNTSYQTWRITDNRIQIDYKYRAAGLSGCLYGELRE